MRILYGIGSWGLGHATRSVPVLHALLKAGHDVTIVSSGRALALLRAALGDRCELLDWPHVPHTLGHSALGFYARSAAAIPLMLRVMIDEQHRTRDLLRRRRFDRIISDNRYGVQHPEVPSFHIAHSLHFIAPGRMAVVEGWLEAFNYHWFRGLRRVIVPDTPEDRLAGDLAHGLRLFPPSLLAYCGILSRLRRREAPADLDLFITLSGPEPQRTILEQLVRHQLQEFRGRAVVALGTPEGTGVQRQKGSTIYGYLDAVAQEEMMNRARVVVGRAGYSTIMDLAETERPAVLIPTPGQTEQVYLARYHETRGTVRGVTQHAFRLERDVPLGAARPGPRSARKTVEAVQCIVDLIVEGGGDAGQGAARASGAM